MPCHPRVAVGVLLPAASLWEDAIHLSPDSTQAASHMARNNTNRHEVVLLSGGIDSATVLALARQQGAAPVALFVDYGQAAASAEAASSIAIAAHYRSPYRALGFSGLSFGPGEIRGRNAFLAHTALLTFEGSVGVVMIGIHSGTTYKDCSTDFVDLMQRSYDFHTNGAIAFSAPVATRCKSDIYGIAKELGVPIELTYSCEAANQPCTSCLSCRDRGDLLAGA